MQAWQHELQRTIELNPYIPVVPTPRQGAFLAYPVLEAGYGGAAGGGKSAGLLMAGLQYVQTPGYHALLLRKTFADLSLPRSLIPLSHEWLARTDASWNGQKYQWMFPSGATVSFGYCENDNDVYRYQGAAFAFVGWDELTQFRPMPYRYLFSRVRKPIGLNVPMRVRATFNPGGIGHEWVRQRFIVEQSESRLFIPAKLEDNPHLDREDYERSLAELDPVTRAQLRHGNWDIRPEGNLFKREWFNGKIVDAAPSSVRSVRFWDLAATKQQDNNDPDYAAGCKMGSDSLGNVYIQDMRHFRDTPQAVEMRVKMTAEMDGVEVPVRIEQEPGASSKLYIDTIARNVLPAFDVRGIPSMVDKVTRSKPFSAACERGNVYLVAGDWINGFLDELTPFPNVGHDDRVDAATGAYGSLFSEPEVQYVGGMIGAAQAR